MASGTIVESVKDATVVASSIIESAENEITWIAPPEILIFAARFGLIDKSNALIEKGGSVRGITRVSNMCGDVIRQLVDLGGQVRHLDHYQGAFMLIGDNKESISSVYLNLEELSLDDQITAFWTDDETYADYLMVTFEAAWKEAVDAKKKLEGL
jgi:hypothetical protein